MAKRLKDYISYMHEIIEKGVDEKDRDRIKRELLVNIEFFQHERIVHLIVTVLFAILMMFAIFCVCFFETIGFMAFAFAVLVLLVPYIRHYYILENGIQELYRCYDKVA